MYFSAESLHLLWKEIRQEAAETGSFISIVITTEMKKIPCGGELRNHFLLTPRPAGACECAGRHGHNEIHLEPSQPDSRMTRPSLSSFSMMKYYLVLELGIGTNL